MAQVAPGERREQLDGLRVVAMVGVLYVHFWNPHPALEFVRVSLFFTLSGFLICLLLLSAKEAGGRIRVVNFYVRRLLRLLPALLLALVVANHFNMDGIRDSIFWHTFQATNFYVVLTEKWNPWVVSHLWSLNVVEQFYIFCPLIIIFVPRRYIFSCFLVMMISIIAIRIFVNHSGIGGWSGVVIFAADPIAAGSLLAIVRDNSNIRSILTNKFNIILSIAIIFSPLAFGSNFGHSESYRLLCIYALASIVLGAYVGYKSRAAILLTNRITRWLSQSSYATYVYHLPIWWIVGEQFPFLQIRGPVTFLVVSAVSIFVATLSWLLVEKHLNALKSHFPVQSNGDAPAILRSASSVRS